MGGIFISHSSKNSAEAEKLRDWLESQGWGRSQVFLDLQDLKSGDSWRHVLNAMGDKEAVIVCLSDDWLGSHECVREFTQAQERGKPIFPIFVAPVTAAIPRFITDLQIGDVTQGGFDKLRDGLLAKRITPQSFQWPPKDEPGRPVYRGLQALDVQDAAIFFGRDADITRGLDELRRLRNGAPQRMLVILGASGAGKSSFLRAGLIARMRRDEENFLVLPIVRPERAAVSGTHGLAASVCAALGRSVALSGAQDLAQAFSELRKPVMDRFARTAEAARETYAGQPPTIIIPLDQAEELFGADNAERAAFCDMVSGALDHDGNALVVATIRSDSYEVLQNGLMPESQATFSLPAIAAGAFQEIIEGPARLAKPPLTIEPALTQRLLADLDAADALPLLAFTLERLHGLHGQDGALTIDDYQNKLGGLSGAIQSAVNAVLGAQPSKDRLALARRLFVPALVQVDQDGVKRRVARRADLPADTQTLADEFIGQRLLVSDDGKLEVAHEAILRQWPALSGWIAEERGALAVLDGVRAAAREWQAPRASGSREAKMAHEWRDTSRLTHRGARLKEAEAVAARADFAAVVDPGMREYLTFCRKAERRAAASQLRMQVLAGVSALAVIGAGFAYTQRATLEPMIVSWWSYQRFAHSSEALMAAAPGTAFQDCREGSTDCPVMVVVPEGTFLMGSAEGAPNASENEFPQREISVARFAVSQHEITFADWNACVAAGGCDGYQPDPAGWEGDNRPVINVSWDHAQKYVEWLSLMTGQEYRLLSEAEWEYAARAGSSAQYSWGDDPPVCEIASENGAAFGAGADAAFGFGVEGACEQQSTWEVGSFQANAFGLYDMHGNVFEWVQDCYAAFDPSNLDGSAIELGAEASGDSASGTSCSSGGVLRGGSWGSGPQYLRSANRGWDYRTRLANTVGFRVARTILPLES